MIKLETIEKYVVATEDEVDGVLAELKTSQDFELVDYKVTQKDTKESSFYLLTTKKRHKTLAEAKESLGL